MERRNGRGLKASGVLLRQVSFSAEQPNIRSSFDGYTGIRGVTVGKEDAHHGAGLQPAYLDQLIEEAVVDAYTDDEQLMGFFAMIEEHLAVPFKTQILGQEVSVTGVELTDDDHIVAACSSGDMKQRISILDLPLPDPLPEGVEWIEAYRRWVCG